MWAQVEQQLATILSTRLFPTLKSDPGYNVFLRNAGVTSISEDTLSKAQDAWRNSVPFQSSAKIHTSVLNLPPATRRRLEQAAGVCARLTVMEIKARRALREERAKAEAIESPTTLIRVWDASDDNRTRHWWFSETLLKQAQKESSAARTSLRAWLRDKLAISLNFGNCDRLSRITLSGAAALPAIIALGLPMPQYSHITRDAGGTTRGVATPDYWARFGAQFEGQKTQYFLPFVPPDRIHDIPFP